MKKMIIVGLVVLGLNISTSWAINLLAPALSGDATGKVGEKYDLNISTPTYGFAPFFYIDWGDGASGFVTPYDLFFWPPVAHGWTDHTYTSPGTFSIRARLQDQEGNQSDWSNPLIVTIEPSPIIGWLEFPSEADWLEYPGYLRPVSGITTIYGWAIDPKGIAKAELFIDNQFVANIPYGGTRQDVKDVFPDYPNAENSGFAMVWNWSILSGGCHKIKVRIYNQDGLTKDLKVRACVMKLYGAEWIQDMNPPSEILLNRSITANGITKNYDITIQWFNELQGFVITNFTPK